MKTSTIVLILVCISLQVIAQAPLQKNPPFCKTLTEGVCTACETGFTLDADSKACYKALTGLISDIETSTTKFIVVDGSNAALSAGNALTTEFTVKVDLSAKADSDALAGARISLIVGPSTSINIPNSKIFAGLKQQTELTVAGFKFKIPQILDATLKVKVRLEAKLKNVTYWQFIELTITKGTDIDFSDETTAGVLKSVKDAVTAGNAAGVTLPDLSLYAQALADKLRGAAGAATSVQKPSAQPKTTDCDTTITCKNSGTCNAKGRCDCTTGYKGRLCEFSDAQLTLYKKVTKNFALVLNASAVTAADGFLYTTIIQALMSCPTQTAESIKAILDSLNTNVGILKDPNGINMIMDSLQQVLSQVKQNPADVTNTTDTQQQQDAGRKLVNAVQKLQSKLMKNLGGQVSVDNPEQTLSVGTSVGKVQRIEKTATAPIQVDSRNDGIKGPTAKIPNGILSKIAGTATNIAAQILSTPKDDFVNAAGGSSLKTDLVDLSISNTDTNEELPVTGLTEAITLSIPQTDATLGAAALKCVYYDVATDSFKSDGCTVKGVTDGYYQVETTHLTTFGLSTADATTTTSTTNSIILTIFAIIFTIFLI